MCREPFDPRLRWQWPAVRLTTRGPSSRVKSPRPSSVVQRGRPCQAGARWDRRSSARGRLRRATGCAGRLPADVVQWPREMPRFKLTIEYAGTRYSGWQIQKNARTVAGEIERAVRDATGVRELELYGAGRTDAGVHALAQVAHLDIRTNVPPARLLRRVNDELPADINILRIDPAPHRFHARHDAIARTYLYQVATRRTAFGKPFVWWVRDPLDVAAMRRAAVRFEGMGDFASFTDDDPDEKSTKVAVTRVRLHEAGDSAPAQGGRVALPLENGAPDGRRPRRGRARRRERTRARRVHAPAVRCSRPADRSPVRPVPGARHLPGRPAAARRSSAAHTARLQPACLGRARFASVTQLLGIRNAAMSGVVVGVVSLVASRERATHSRRGRPPATGHRRRSLRVSLRSANRVPPPAPRGVRRPVGATSRNTAHAVRRGRRGGPARRCGRVRARRCGPRGARSRAGGRSGS